MEELNFLYREYLYSDDQYEKILLYRRYWIKYELLQIKLRVLCKT